jgi:hypothetical protein
LQGGSQGFESPQLHLGVPNEELVPSPGIFLPAAIDALGKEYEAKTKALEEENAQLKKKVEQMEWDIERNLIELVEDKKGKARTMYTDLRTGGSFSKGSHDYCYSRYFD